MSVKKQVNGTIPSRIIIPVSIDMMKTPFGWTWDYSEAILDERFNDFTQEITRLAEVPRLTMKFLVDLCRDPCGQKLVQIRFA